MVLVEDAEREDEAVLAFRGRRSEIATEGRRCELEPDSRGDGEGLLRRLGKRQK